MIIEYNVISRGAMAWQSDKPNGQKHTWKSHQASHQTKVMPKPATTEDNKSSGHVLQGQVCPICAPGPGPVSQCWTSIPIYIEDYFIYLFSISTLLTRIPIAHLCRELSQAMHND